MAQVDIIIEDDRWSEDRLTPAAQAACDGVFDALSLPALCEVTVLACNDVRITGLNGDFRNKPSATNVLSWPSEDRAALVPGDTPLPPDPDMQELGDIAISYETCVREAGEQGKPFEDHVTHLLVHATLHLVGYDHETEQDAALMEGLETRILAKLGIADPY